MSTHVMYGIGSMYQNYRVKTYAFCNKDDTILTKAQIIETMLSKYPSIEMIYETQSTREMKEIFWDVVHHNTMANNVEFKVILEQVGKKVYDRKIDF